MSLTTIPSELSQYVLAVRSMLKTGDIPPWSVILAQLELLQALAAKHLAASTFLSRSQSMKHTRSSRTISGRVHFVAVPLSEN